MLKEDTYEVLVTQDKYKVSCDIKGRRVSMYQKLTSDKFKKDKAK